MITVHHLNNSRSQRILWLLEELGVDYELKKYERDPVTMLAPASLKAVHPLGKSPVVTDGDKTLAESGLIVSYLADTYGAGKLAPAPGTPERLRYEYWLHYAEGSAMPPLLLKLVFDQVKTKAPFLVRPIARAIAGQVEKTFLKAQLDTHFGYVDAELGKSTWLVGDELTAADIQMSFPLEAYVARGRPERPRLNAFVERITARPAYKRAIERGGPYGVLK